MISKVQVWAGLAAIVVASIGPETYGQDMECGTYRSGSSCSNGACDPVGERNLWQPDESTPMMVIRIGFVVFRDGVEDNEAVSESRLSANFNQLNDDFRDYRIQFDWVNDDDYFVTSAQFNHFSDTCNANPPIFDECACDLGDPDCDPEDYVEAALMQYGASETDLDATTSLNVFISIQSDYRGISDFPWYQDVDTFLHGIRMRGFWVGGQDDCYNETCQSLTHEVGHALGLLHTHEGSPNPGSCTACAEPYTCDGTCQDEECDEFGDLCCDTAATSLHYCDDFEDLGGCLNGTWEDVDVSNYMSYSDDGCWDHFTPQQVSRMHCWVCNAHPGWIVDDDCNESGMPDVCDITRGDSEDCDENGVPDECQWMPERACCYDSTCDVMIGCECDELGGTFLGEYSSCSGAPCAMFGP